MSLEAIKQWGRIHMIGIGGVSMSGIAEMLKDHSIYVTGSDKCESDNTKHLQDLGLDIYIGSNKEMIANADLIVYTAAIPKTDIEYCYAQELNKIVMERSEFLGEITKCFQECICISGTHGKTTTTSMISMVFLAAKLDPTIEVGAYLKSIKGNNKTGNSEYFILEACEYVDSFLKFYPHTEIILNIDNDHLDYFKNIENIKKSFFNFTNQLNETGTIIANIDDENTKEVIDKANHKKITYGIENEGADFQAKNIKLNSYGYPTFDCYKNEEYYDTYTLNVHGSHNILNALATIATSDTYFIKKEFIKEGLSNFTGANRRFELIGKYKDIPVFDDYAHHPTEIKTTLQCTKDIPHNKTWAIFEPHTYSRAKNHLEEFANVLADFDYVILADIYAARETNEWNISSIDLLELIKKENQNCIYLESYDKIVTYLKENVQKNDIIITIGAGTINQVGYALIEKNQEL